MKQRELMINSNDEIVVFRIPFTEFSWRRFLLGFIFA